MTTNGILVLTGPPCSGKSSVGRALAAIPPPGDRNPIEIDSLFEMLFPGSDRNRDDRMLAYDAAHVLARMFFERGGTPVLECTYSRLQQRASLVDALVAIPEAPLWVVELDVAPDEAFRRWRVRNQPRDLNERLVRKRAEMFPYSDQPLRLNSAGRAPEDLARDIASWLEQQPRSAQRDVWMAAGNDWD